MEFGPIFRSLLRSRARVILIVAEVALTLAIVAQGNPAPLMPQLEKALLGVERGRFLRLRTTVDNRGEFHGRDRLLVASLDAVMALLVLVTALGSWA